jgi:Concanavalin A-like lectin/glucanases superfamily
VLLGCGPIACSQLDGLEQYRACADCASGGAPSDVAGAVGDGDAAGSEESGGNEAAAGAPDAGRGTDVREAGGDGAIEAPDVGADAGAGAAGDSGEGDSGRVDGGDASASTLSSGLVALYLFDETSGTSAADSSGNGHAATLSGGATFASGLQNNAVTLSGSNQYVSLPSGIVSGLSSFSICTWVKLSAAPQWSRIFDFGTGTTEYMFLTPNSGAGTRFGITTAGNGQEQQLNAPALATGSWQHVAVTLTAGTGTLYVNGAQVAQNTNMTLSPMSLGTTTQNWLGRSQFGVDPYLSGQIDNFRIYDRALSAAEVQTLYAGDL